MNANVLYTTELTISQVRLYIKEIVPWNTQANELNFEHIVLWQLSHANWNRNISSEETLVTKDSTNVNILKEISFEISSHMEPIVLTSMGQRKRRF